MYKPEGFSGVMSFILAFILLSMLLLAIETIKAQKKNTSITFGNRTSFTIILVISIAIGVFSAFYLGDHFKKGDYSEHGCFYCKEPSVYEVKTGGFTHWYCENHYSDAVKDYGREEAFEQSRQNKRDVEKCQVCGREFQKGTEDAKSIKWNNMCKQCLKNYKTADNMLDELKK